MIFRVLLREGKGHCWSSFFFGGGERLSLAAGELRLKKSDCPQTDP
ncbi:hypothetical protein [Riemerella anatipestifer]|nr:hypothetical protein [Riemerella anatipestifer]MCO4303435.1 hypothetical protein [Riemerella anatipestifer]MCO7352394.1 hypothetical protein [Riemerella anatipestifer]MCQ4038687.1 hypothetical protein [Riemerella anatipestifer]MCT6760431.1 hypothetical protein [Riemerella anatipestifer]MCT6764414.1 hypothetical protein [Riemerella anatipestifer]